MLLLNVKEQPPQANKREKTEKSEEKAFAEERKTDREVF
jgi:hypothetical protein